MEDIVYDWEPYLSRRDETLLDVSAVAKHLDVHRNSVCLMLRTGRLKGARMGRHWRIKPSDLRRFVDEGGSRYIVEKRKGRRL